MANDTFMILGAPSPRLRTMASELGLQPPAEVPPTQASALWTRSLSGASSRALFLYRTPAAYLEERLRDLSPESIEQAEAVASKALADWQAMHAAMLGLWRKHEDRSVLVNADRATDVGALRSALEQRFSQPLGQARPHTGERGAAGHEDALSLVIDSIAPECLELYARLESCALVCGREPELEFATDAQRGRALNDTLYSVSRESRLQKELADLRKELAAAQERARKLKKEIALYLGQLRDIHEELAEQAERNRAHEARIADLEAAMMSSPRPALLRRPPLGWLWWIDPRARRLNRQIRVLRESGEFDEAWYLMKYPDVARAGQDPVLHYLQYGAGEARDPSVRFDTSWYLEANQDVAKAGVNPLLHYLEHGRGEGRQPAPPARS